MKYFRNAFTAFLTVPLISIGCSIAAGQHAVCAEISGSITSSTPNINVYRYVNTTPTLIYTGPVSGYDGILSDMDFSSARCAVVFDWDSDAYIYAERADNTVSYIDAVTNIPSRANSNRAETMSGSGMIATNMSIVYDNKYYENILMPNEQLNVPITISNGSGSEKKYIPYIARFDIGGKLIGIVTGEKITVPPNSTASGSISEILSGDALSTAKIFLWEEGTQKPAHDAIAMTVNSADYYSDTFDSAEEIIFDKPLCGVINSENDVDIVKFKPVFSGLYAMRISSDNGVNAGLYNSSGALITAANATDKYIFYSLEQNQNYYLKFDGNANKSYTITPAVPSAAQTLTKNIGANASANENAACNVFSFTPAENGTYVITAVGTENVKASLYNEDFTFAAANDISDGDVSFRISHEMQAGKTYYILVSPKTASAEYILYAEQPLALISVE